VQAVDLAAPPNFGDAQYRKIEADALTENAFKVPHWATFEVYIGSPRVGRWVRCLR
jgi:hypothetical protein